MTYRGYLRDGVVILEDAVNLPNGTKVKVEFLPSSPQRPGDDEIPTLYERLEPFVGKARGLPPDMSANLDHYLYGLPKKQ